MCKQQNHLPDIKFIHFPYLSFNYGCSFFREKQKLEGVTSTFHTSEKLDKGPETSSG